VVPGGRTMHTEGMNNCRNTVHEHDTECTANSAIGFKQRQENGYDGRKGEIR